MTEKSDRTELATLYGALLGGLIASFAGSVVFGLFLAGNQPVTQQSPIWALAIGMGCVLAFMAGGVYFTGRATWLARALLFASGFTALWTLVLSLGVEPRWVSVIAYGVAIAAGIGLGAWRFAARDDEGRAPSEGEVTWIH